MTCPVTVDTTNGIKAVCNHTEPMKKDVLIAHLINDHHLAIDVNRTCFKTVRKRARPVLGEKDANETVNGTNAARSVG